MKPSNISFFILYFCFFSPAICSSFDSFSETTSSGGSPLENRTPRSCSANDWLDALALEQKKKPKKTSESNRAVSPLLDKSNDLNEFKLRLDDDREILRQSAEALLEQKARSLEDELFVEWADYWRDVCDKKVVASFEE